MHVCVHLLLCLWVFTLLWQHQIDIHVTVQFVIRVLFLLVYGIVKYNAKHLDLT